MPVTQYINEQWVVCVRGSIPARAVTADAWGEFFHTIKMSNWNELFWLLIINVIMINYVIF